MIIGITGTLGAGKGTIVEFLKERGFLHYSVRDFLTEEILRRGLEVNRDNMIFVANDLRFRFGGSYIVEELYRKAMEKGGDVVIESVRCVEEVGALRRKEEFVLWAVDADIETRYARIVERKSASDNVSFQDFVRQEESEMENVDLTKQNLKKCVEMADHVFRNDWTKSELKGKIEMVLSRSCQKSEIRNQKSSNNGKSCDFVRPNWDEYFLKIMDVVAGRVTCDRARAGGGGCLIVKNKQILATGYVGSPPGCAHCDDVGHLFKKSVHDDGKITNHCVRTTHAEQNAICQAAKKGVAIEGATLYCFAFPCYVCAKLIITSGIKKVVAVKDYHASKDSKDLFREAGVEFELLNEEVLKYDKM